MAHRSAAASPMPEADASLSVHPVPQHHLSKTQLPAHDDDNTRRREGTSPERASYDDVEAIELPEEGTHAGGMHRQAEDYDDDDGENGDTIALSLPTPPPLAISGDSAAQLQQSLDVNDTDDDPGREGCLDPERALFCLSMDNGCRAVFIRIVQSRAFFIIVLSVIILNSLALAIPQPRYSNPDWLEATLYWLEIGCTAFFAIEMIIKVIAMGFLLHPGAYLRNPWNLFDCFITILAIVALVTNQENVTSLRAWRILRALRAISHVGQLRALVETLFKAMQPVLTSLVIIVWFMLLFAVFGVLRCGGGTMSQRCYNNATLLREAAVEDVGDSTAFNISNLPHDTEMVLHNDIVGRGCGAIYACSENQTCMVNRSQFDAAPLTFDDIGESVLVTVKLIAIDNWNIEMNRAAETCGVEMVLAMIGVTLIGGFVMMNVFLAILMTEYTKAMNKQIAEAEAQVMLEEAAYMMQLENDEEEMEEEAANNNSGGGGNNGNGNLVELELSEIPDAESDEALSNDGVTPHGRSSSTTAAAAMLAHTSSIIKSPNARKYIVSPRPAGEGKSPRVGFGSANSDPSLLSPADANNTSSGAFANEPSSLAFTKSVRFAPNVPGSPAAPTPKVGAAGGGGGRTPKKGYQHTPTNASMRKQPSLFEAVLGGNSNSKAALFEDVDFLDSDDELMEDVAALRPTRTVKEFGDADDDNTSALRTVGTMRAAQANGGGTFNRKGTFSHTPKHGPVSNRSMTNAANNRSMRLGANKSMSSFAAAAASNDSVTAGAGNAALASNTSFGAFGNFSMGELPPLSPADPGGDNRGGGPHQHLNTGGFGLARKRPSVGFGGSVRRLSLQGGSTGPAGRRLSGQAANSSFPRRSPGAGPAQPPPPADGLLLPTAWAADDGTSNLSGTKSDLAVTARSDGPLFSTTSSHQDLLQPALSMGGQAMAMSRVFDGLPGFDEDEDDALVADELGPDDERPSECRIRLRRFVEIFAGFMLFVTCVNVVVLAMDHYGIDDDMAYVLEMISLVCACLFALELVLKVVAFGPVKTFRDKFNLFDLFLVIATVVEYTLASTTTVSALRAVRILRLLRAFKVLRVTKRLAGLRILISALAPSVVPALFVLLLLIIVVFVYCVLGMQFFGHADFAPFRVKYDTIWEAALSNFIVITGDNWADLMLLAAKHSGMPVAVSFFLSLFFFGNYIVINLFGAVIVDHLERAAQSVWDEQHFEQSLASFTEGQDLHPPRLFMPDINDSDSEEDEEGQHKAAVDMSPGSAAKYADNNEPGELSEGSAEDRALVPPPPLLMVPSPGGGRRESTFSAPPALQIPQSTKNANSATPRTPAGVTPRSARTPKPKQRSDAETGAFRFAGEKKSALEVAASYYKDTVVERVQPLLQGDSFFLFGPANCLRRMASALVLSAAWPALSFAVTFVNCIFIVAYSPTAEGRLNGSVGETANLAFVVFYGTEMLLQMLARGVILPFDDIPRFEDGGNVGGMSERDDVVTSAYLSQSGAWTNIVIVAAGVCGIFFPAVRIADSIRGIRLAMEIKPLRMLVTSLVQTLPNIVQAVLLAFVFWTIFAIFGVQLFKGTYYECTDPRIGWEADCVGLSNDTSIFNRSHIDANWTVADIPSASLVDSGGEPFQRVWKRYDANFDDFSEAMFSLFVVAIGEQWTSVMYHGIDTTEPQRGPKKDNQQELAFFFIVFIFIGRFLTLNILIGVLITFFLHGKRRNDGTMLLSADERAFLLTKRVLDTTMFGHDPVPPKNCVRRGIFAVVSGTIADVRTWCASADEQWVEGDDVERRKRRIKHRGKGKHIIVLDVPIYEVIAAICVLGYTLVLMARGLDLLPEGIEDYVFAGMVGFIVLDMVFKMVAYSVFDYAIMTDARRDFFILFVVGASFVIPSLSIYGRLVILLRTTRILAFLTANEHAQKLFALVIHSLPMLVTVIAVLGIMFLIFAGVGVRLFAKAPLNPPLDELTNFRTSWNAAFTLYQVLTTEGWLDIANACSKSDDADPCETCSRSTSYPYFVFFVSTAFIVFLQLCAVVVVEYFEELDDCADRKIVAAFADVKTQWQIINRATSRTLTADKLLRLVKAIPRRLTGLPMGAQPAQLFQLVRELHIPLGSDMRIQYRPFVHSLALYAFRISLSQVRSYATRMHEELHDPRCFTAAHLLAVRVISLKWKEFLADKKARLETSHLGGAVAPTSILRRRRSSAAPAML